MESVPVDVATLSELSESSILSCLEERFKSQHFQGYVGQVLLSVDPVWRSLSAAQGALLVPEFAADVLQNASVLCEDHSIILCGYQGSGKTVVLHQLLASLISGLASTAQLEQKVIDAMWLVQALTTQTSGLAHDGHSVTSGNQAMVGVRLMVKDGQLLGSALSCLLLNTSNLRHFSVFQMNGVCERLEAVGLSFATAEQFMKLLVELDLLGEGQVSNLMTISETMDKEERERLAGLLYTHLVHWLVCHLNKELAPPTTAEGYYNVDLYDPPGVSMPTQSSETGSLVDLVQTYISEVMHNIYCHRLFLWEQDQYIEDGVEWEYIPVQTNDVLIEAFQQAGGMLDAVGSSSARAISTAVATACQAHPELCFTTQDENTFIVSQFTGERGYTISEEWIKTNSTHLPPLDQILQSLLSSSNDLLCLLAQSVSQLSPDSLFGVVWPSGLNLTSRVHRSTLALMDAITTSQPQFVLCLSPHSSNADANKFVEIDRDYMLAQLQQFRILDTALIQSCGYPVHIEMTRFVDRYSPLLMEGKGLAIASRDISTITQAVLSKRNLSDYRVGNIQVFLKPWHLRQLDSELELFQASARKLQQAFRRSCLQRQSEHLRLESAVKRVLEERGGDYDTVSTDSGSSEEEGEREDSSLGRTKSIPSKNDEVRLNSPPTVRGHAALSPSPTCKLEGEGACPPSPPPRPQHTLSQDSFSVDDDRVGPLMSRNIPSVGRSSPSTSRSIFSPGRGSPTKSKGIPSGHSASGNNTHTSRPNPKKASWRKPKHRPAVSHDPMMSMTAMETLQQGSWYHGKVSRDLAERCLKVVSFDCFLVRESEKRVGEYSLSLKHKGIIKHFRIDVKRGSRIRYELFGAQRSFPTLSDLIDFYSRHCITNVGEVLTAPCPSEGSSEATPPPLPPPRKKNLSSIRRKEPPAIARTQQSKRSSAPVVSNGAEGSGTRPLSVVQSFDLSDESVATLLRELEIEERIVDAARRMADMPTRNRKEKQQRRQSLQQAQSRLLSLRQQYHTVQERKRFIEVAINNIPTPNRRISSPTINSVH